MKFRAVGAALTLAGLLLAVAPGMAHHEILAKFDDTKPVTLKGIVTLVDWANPHVHVFINVAGGKELINWAIEYESPIDLQQSGWNADSLQPGDAITVQGMSAIDGHNVDGQGHVGRARGHAARCAADATADAESAGWAPEARLTARFRRLLGVPKHDGAGAERRHGRHGLLRSAEEHRRRR
jgi:Family of unknown function (DUF6152)